MHLRQCHAGELRQRVVRPHDGEHRGTLLILHTNALNGCAAIGQADVRIATQHRLRYAHGLLGPKVKLDARMLLTKRRDDARHKLDRKTIGAGKAHPPALQPLQALNIGDHALGLQRLAQRVRGEQFARCAGPHAARLTLEQRHTQQFFEHRHLPADG